MKQKYTIFKDENTDGVKIQEHAELSKDLFSLVCEESYDAETIKSALGENKKALIDTLRTPNLYPISEYIDEIADAVAAIYDPSDEAGESGPVELVFDDADLFRKKETPEEAAPEESVEIEDLLEDDTEEEILDDTVEKTTDSNTDLPQDLSIDTSDDESHESPDDTGSLP